jgi:Zn-dependent peptidase ImmA (M78 family)
MPGMRWYGASKWLTPTKAMILLGLRGKREDQFWFSFFHEAGHILNDSRKDVYINDGTRDDRREKDADTFATSLLVPPQFHPRLQCLKTKTELIAFAKETGISPGIVAGQFQHLTHKWNWFNGLKRKFTWTS